MDVSDAVRKQAFLVLANKCGMADLTASQRALLLRRGLRDRVGGVADAARTLVQVWLVDSCMSDVTELLRHIDVQRHPGVCFVRVWQSVQCARPTFLASVDVRIFTVVFAAEHTTCQLDRQGWVRILSPHASVAGCWIISSHSIQRGYTRRQCQLGSWILPPG